MKRKFAICFVAALLVIFAPIRAAASEDPVEVTLTCYLPTGNPTKSGCMPYYGVAAGCDEWYGKTAYIYKMSEDGGYGDLIGIFEFKDTGTGKNDAIKKGYVIDVFVESTEDIIPTQRVRMIFVDAVG